MKNFNKTLQEKSFKKHLIHKKIQLNHLLSFVGDTFSQFSGSSIKITFQVISEDNYIYNIFNIPKKDKLFIHDTSWS